MMSGRRPQASFAWSPMMMAMALPLSFAWLHHLFLGHASISTTQVYTRVSPQYLLEVFVTSHPRGT